MSLSMSLSFFSLNKLKIHLSSPFTSSHHFPLPHLSTLNPNLKTHSVLMNPSSSINVHMSSNKFKRATVSQTSAKFSPPNLSIWTRLVLLGSILLTVPFYKRILKVGDRMEKTVETTVEIVEKVTEETKKVASDLAGALPEGNLKQEALEVKKFAEEVEKDAKNIEVFLHKVDKIKEEVEELMEPLIEKEEQREQEKQDIMDHESNYK